MSVDRLYDTTVTIQRLAPVGTSNKAAYQTLSTNVPCRISQAEATPSFVGEGAVYKRFKMWCAANVDILENDRVVDNGTTYSVSGMKTAAFRERSEHKEVLLELAQ